MSYGSGNGPFMGSSGTKDNSNRTGLSNRYSPYQNSVNYNPPAVSGSYVQQQTQVLEDTMRTHYEVRQVNL